MELLDIYDENRNKTGRTALAARPGLPGICNWSSTFASSIPGERCRFSADLTGRACFPGCGIFPLQEIPSTGKIAIPQHSGKFGKNLATFWAFPACALP